MKWTIPTVAECDPGVDPFEFQILCAMAEPMAVTAGGIFLTEETKDRNGWGADHARLLAVSPSAFTYHKFPEGTRLPQVGDVVFVGKYPGEPITGRDGKEYRLCGDREVKAVIERAEAQTLEQSRAA